MRITRLRKYPINPKAYLGHWVLSFYVPKANLKDIFVSPYRTLFYWYGSVGQIFFLTSKIGYTLKLIVYSKTCLKRPLKKKTKNCC